MALAGAGGAVRGSADRASTASAVSSYAGQLGSSVRGFSQQEVDNLLNGRGLAYARMAVVNGYPCPLHVLPLKKDLGLTPAQVAGIESTYKQMQVEARSLGKEIVDRERQISGRFAHRTITQAELQTRVEELAWPTPGRPICGLTCR